MAHIKKPFLVALAVILWHICLGQITSKQKKLERKPVDLVVIVGI